MEIYTFMSEPFPRFAMTLHTSIRSPAVVLPLSMFKSMHYLLW